MNTSFDKELFLKNLGTYLNLDIDAKVDRGLVLLVDETYRIQIEFLEDRILTSSILGEILVSNYRNQVFEDALKSNFKSSEFGSIGYSDKEKFLILSHCYPIFPPVEKEYFYILEGFIAKAKIWIEALKSSNTRLLA